jgi:hypothetical protein
MVRSRRSTATGLRYAELVGVDWKLPSSISLTGRTRGSWRSFDAARRGLGMPAVAALEFAGARVSVTSRDEREREKERGI